MEDICLRTVNSVSVVVYSKFVIFINTGNDPVNTKAVTILEIAIGSARKNTWVHGF